MLFRSGVNVSRHFDTSNILLAANITAMCRCGMYLTEKALNIYQTITDGGICELNEVIHLMSKKIDSSLFVRAYQMKNKDLTLKHKWKHNPITENRKRILFKKGKGWLIDGEYYGNIDRDLYIEISKKLENYKKIYGENHEFTKQKEIDTEMIQLDGTIKKGRFGANTILSVSIAISKAGAAVTASTATCSINASTFVATASGGAYTSPATAMVSGDYGWFAKASV